MSAELPPCDHDECSKTNCTQPPLQISEEVVEALSEELNEISYGNKEFQRGHHIQQLLNASNSKLVEENKELKRELSATREELEKQLSDLKAALLRLLTAASLMRIIIKERAALLTKTTDWERLKDAMRNAERELKVPNPSAQRMRVCPKCHETSVADDGYCGGRCREVTSTTLERACEDEWK